MMKVQRTTMGRFLAVLLALIISPSIQAVIPRAINFQGYLTDGGGAPLTGSQSVTFCLYTVDVGGTPQWCDTQTVTVNQGLFDVALDESTTPFPPGIFDTPLYLSLNVNGDGEMSPRIGLTSEAFAFHADDADTVSGVSVSSLDQSADLAAHVNDTNNPHNVTAAQIGAASAAEVDAAIATHAGDPSAHHTKTTSFTELTDQITDGQIPSLITRDTELAVLQATVDSQAGQLGVQASQISALQTQVTALQDLLQHFSRAGNDVYVTGANLHIVNGTGTTAGAVNSLGNLIVGYNQLRGSGDDRSGSHNLVVGDRQNYSSYGGLVAGNNNAISGGYASVSGGNGNTASGAQSSVSGGGNNTASGMQSSVSGGGNNIASSSRASVSGGYNNQSSGVLASISGGYSNTASGQFALVSGGELNHAFADRSAILGGLYNLSGDGSCAYNSSAGRVECAPGTDHSVGQYSTVSAGQGSRVGADYASVSGGMNNTATGQYASVSGGYSNTASGAFSSVGGGELNQAFADNSAILGGFYNLSGDGSCVYNATTSRIECTPGTDHSIGQYSTVSAGSAGHASGAYATVSAGYANTASGNFAAVSGGSDNTASGGVASVSGGIANIANNLNTSVSGGKNNTASGGRASVSGGEYNTASGFQSSVSGGLLNVVSGDRASISGGASRSATGQDDWVAGGLFQDN